MGPPPRGHASRGDSMIARLICMLLDHVIDGEPLEVHRSNGDLVELFFCQRCGVCFLDSHILIEKLEAEATKRRE